MIPEIITSIMGQGSSNSIKRADFAFFSIEEQIEAARNPIKLKLLGNMLPFIPFQLGGEQKLVEKYYPGNPEPSVQVMGAREAPVTIKGRLQDKRQPVGSEIAWRVKDVLEDIRKRGNLVRISLGDQWIRYGFLQTTKFPMRDRNNLEYELTFFLVSENKPQQNPIITDKKQIPRDVGDDLKKINASMANNLLSYPEGYPKDIFDQVNDIVNGVSKQVKQVTDAVDNIISLAEKSSAVLNRTVALLASARSYVYKSSQRLGMIALDEKVREGTLKEAFDYGGVTLSYKGVKSQNQTSGYRSVTATLGTLREMSQAQVMLQSLSDDIIAYINSISNIRHRVKDGETLQTIAVKYYGTADQWEKIYTHNKLTSSILVTGTVLEIPK
jgi:LysM repeat protein